jgi:hypothetical protein
MSLFGAIPLAEKAKDVTPPAEDAWDLFPIGQRVRIIRASVDFEFFRGDETGTVVRNEHRYLSIIVRYDQPRRYQDETKVKGFREKWEHGFNPDDLLPIQERRQQSAPFKKGAA